MIVPVMAISNLVLTQQIYSEETNGAHAQYRELVPLKLYPSNLQLMRNKVRSFSILAVFCSGVYQNQNQASERGSAGRVLF